VGGGGGRVRGGGAWGGWGGGAGFCWVPITTVGIKGFHVRQNDENLWWSLHWGLEFSMAKHGRKKGRIVSPGKDHMNSTSHTRRNGGNMVVDVHRIRIFIRNSPYFWVKWNAGFGGHRESNTLVLTHSCVAWHVVEAA